MSDAKEAPAPKADSGGGIKAMLPLIVNLVAMPAIAFALTQFVLVPKLRAPAPAAEHAEDGAEGHGGEAADAHGEAASEHGEKKEGHGGGEAHGEKKDAHGGGKASKAPVPLSSKILVNVAGTMGTRYLQANISLAGKAGLKESIEKFDAQLRDAAAGALASKTIADLEKPGARNLIRTELLGVFNTILGNGSVSELYLTDFAIQ